MKLAILINTGPYTHQASATALQFVRAALTKGHEVSRVFFYHDGVHNGSALTVAPPQERHLPQEWSVLATTHGIDLVLCVNAAQRRGIKESKNLAPGFRLSGLGQLIEAGILADRLVVFGG